jgi:hypothetical protein
MSALWLFLRTAVISPYPTAAPEPPPPPPVRCQFHQWELNRMSLSSIAAKEGYTGRRKKSDESAVPVGLKSLSQ